MAARLEACVGGLLEEVFVVKKQKSGKKVIASSQEGRVLHTSFVAAKVKFCCPHQKNFAFAVFFALVVQGAENNVNVMLLS